MGFAFYSLRTGILSYLALLILAAMLLTNVVMVTVARNDLIQQKTDSGRLAIYALGRMIGKGMEHGDRGITRLTHSSDFSKEIQDLLEAGGFSQILIVNDTGAKVLSIGPEQGVHPGNFLPAARQALATRSFSFGFYGSAWGVIWLARKNLTVSGPLLFNGKIMGAVTIGASLYPVYQRLRESEKLVLIYIFLNTLILVLFGGFLLSRSVVRPVQRLVRLTDDFAEEGAFGSLKESVASKDELGQLHRSLNRMLTSLEKNKQDLEDHIASLEKANQEIRKAQEEIVRSEKLASVGRLATGVAHEIGNPLGIILGNLELLKNEDLDQEERKNLFLRTESEIRRVDKIIRQLLDFSKPEETQRKKISVHDLIEETMGMMEPQPILSHMSLYRDFRAEQDTVLADPNQLKQVLLNLIINAADAMRQDESQQKEGGENTLTIRTENTDRFIELRFSDNGPGIPEEELDYIFEPFYTTKGSGKGTGLGLSVSYRIVDDLGGTMRAESTQGEGTTIMVRLPLHFERESRESDL